MKRYIKSAVSEPDPTDYDTLWTMLDNPKLRPFILDDMYDKYPNVWSGIAQHPNSSTELLLKIANNTPACSPGVCDEKTTIFDALAHNPNSSAQILDIVAHKCAGWSYMRLIKNPNTSYRTLSYISKDMDKATTAARRLAKERMKER